MGRGWRHLHRSYSFEWTDLLSVFMLTYQSAICCLCFRILTCPVNPAPTGSRMIVFYPHCVECVCCQCYINTPSITYRECNSCIFCNLHSQSSRRDTDCVSREADCQTWYGLPASDVGSCWVYSLIPSHTLFFRTKPLNNLNDLQQYIIESFHVFDQIK